MDAGIIRCFKAHYCNGFTRLALERSNAGIKKIYNIDQLQDMKLAAAAWDSVKPTTITKCWQYARLARPLSSDTNTALQWVAPADNAMEAENVTECEAQALIHEKVAQRPNLLDSLVLVLLLDS
ncbi:hypothetical protein RSAG8_08179, partial [Rhizoctonia solani AG-8 WAC10335]